MGKIPVQLDKEDLELINMCIKYYQDQTGIVTEHSKTLTDTLTGIWLEMELAYLRNKRTERA